MSPELKSDLNHLQSVYAIDDSMIESLVSSPEQARDHIRFWSRLTWMMNGAVIALCVVVLTVCVRSGLREGPIWVWVIAVVAFLGAMRFVSVLHFQRRAVAEIKRVATDHNLI